MYRILSSISPLRSTGGLPGTHARARLRTRSYRAASHAQCPKLWARVSGPHAFTGWVRIQLPDVLKTRLISILMRAEMQLLEVVTGHSQFLSHFSIPQAMPTQPVTCFERWCGHEAGSTGGPHQQVRLQYVLSVCNESVNFSLENSESLLEFPTISRWLRCFVAD